MTSDHTIYPSINQLSPSVTSGIVKIQRTLRHPPAAVYAAWSARDAQQCWGHPGEGWWLKAEHFAFQVGHVDVWRFGLQGEAGYVNQNHHILIDPPHRIVYLSTLQATDAGTPSFGGVVAVDFEATPDGDCQLRFEELGAYMDGQDNEADHLAGWVHMLDQLETFLDGQQPRLETSTLGAGQK